MNIGPNTNNCPARLKHSDISLDLRRRRNGRGCGSHSVVYCNICCFLEGKGVSSGGKHTHTHKHTSALFESDLLSDPLRGANVHYWLMQNFEVPQMAPLVIIHARRSGFATRKLSSERRRFQSCIWEPRDRCHFHRGPFYGAVCCCCVWTSCARLNISPEALTAPCVVDHNGK